MRNKKIAPEKKELYEYAYDELAVVNEKLGKGQAALEALFMFKYSTSAIIKYYKLKRELKKSIDLFPENIQKQIKELPNNVWLMHIYLFEFVQLLVGIVMFITYLRIVGYGGEFGILLGAYLLGFYFYRRKVFVKDMALRHLLREIEMEIAILLDRPSDFRRWSGR